MSRKAVPAFYDSQRDRYRAAFESLGLRVHSGNGGFYHWCKLDGITASELNDRLFPTGAAVLKGTDCDMARLGDEGPLGQFFRFSFGPLKPDSFDEDIALMRAALEA